MLAGSRGGTRTEFHHTETISSFKMTSNQGYAASKAMSVESSSEESNALTILCKPELSVFFTRPERVGTVSSWWGHVPFAHWLVRAHRPRVIVELGVRTGVSYGAF